jgi:hypothetical protein
VQRFNAAMPALTRKQINEQPERWQIHYAGLESRWGVVLFRSAIFASPVALNQTALPKVR